MPIPEKLELRCQVSGVISYNFDLQSSLLRHGKAQASLALLMSQTQTSSFLKNNCWKACSFQEKSVPLQQSCKNDIRQQNLRVSLSENFS